MTGYWKNSLDVEADTGKNILRYYAEAQRLQVCMPYWTDDSGNQKQGKTVAINIAALLETQEAVQLIKSIFEP